MFEFIAVALVGAVCIVIGILNSMGHISMLHSYHRSNVKAEYVIPFGRLVGLGMIIIGIAVIICSALSIVTLITEIKTYMHVGEIILGAGLISGTVIAFCAMKKYNGGIFK